MNKYEIVYNHIDEGMNAQPSVIVERIEKTTPDFFDKKIFGRSRRIINIVNYLKGYKGWLKEEKGKWYKIGQNRDTF
tara:strand:+ start:348 stop:578 length:231 start_codon:yes stop_codon:yes gene_type:complete